jgi:hypothetical protein
MTFIIAFLVSLSTAFAGSETCTNVDLTAPSQPLASVPSWSQGHSNLCYAYSASSLIDAYRFEKGDKDVKHFTSPLLLAARTIEKYSRIGSTLAGGKIEHAFASARDFGSCDIKVVSDKLGSYNTDRILLTLEDQYKKSKATAGSKPKIAEKVIQFLESAGISSESLPSVDEVEKNFALGQDEFVAETLLKFCGDTKNLEDLPKPTLMFRPRADAETLTEKLNQLLTSRIPVGVNFCANVATDPAHEGHMQDGEWICKNKMNHSAIIAGRRMNKGRCQYLVQDSGCDGYANGSPGCVSGRYWVSSDRMIVNTHGIFWLE